jgi:diguanylate cyclase (GGDEF)-like protein
LAFQQAKEGRATHTLLYLDLDQFKLVNDTCGHMAGDQLLREIATSLKRIVRDSDTLARLGGDEFGLLLQNCDALLAQRLATQIHQAVKDFTFVWKDKSFKVGASIGIVEINSEVESSTQLMSDADVACYAAKDNGGNRMHLYQPDDNELAQRKGEMRWVSRINHALEKDRFILLAQPIVPVQDGQRISHYELLLRMIDEDGSLIAPDSFIPAAERYKLMYKVDRLVIHKALQFYSEHRSRIDGTVLTINLSGFSLTQETLSEFIRQEFQHHNIEPGHFCFEITETAAISNLSQAQKVMHELKDIGASFALDDFGSGLSSFNYLKNLHVDYLKIDGSFIRDMSEDALDTSIVDAINKIGQELGLKTIAEFVENEAIMQQLREIGVDYAQGYAIGLPMPLEEIYNSISSSERAIMTASSRPNSEG